MTRLVVCVAGLLALLGDGRGEDASREGVAGETYPQPRVAPQTITEADSGDSFTLSPAAGTSLRLSGPYLWSEPTVHGDAVELARIDYFQDPGFSEWAVLAARPGTATIAARGNPQCGGQERCPGEPLRFEIEITVAT